MCLKRPKEFLLSSDVVVSINGIDLVYRCNYRLDHRHVECTSQHFANVLSSYNLDETDIAYDFKVTKIFIEARHIFKDIMVTRVI